MADLKTGCDWLDKFPGLQVGGVAGEPPCGKGDL